MSEREVRRPRNIIPVQTPAQGQAAAPVLRQAERFHRVLHHGRRMEATVSSTASAASPERGDASVSSAGTATSAGTREAGPVAAVRGPRTVPPVRAAAATAMDWSLQAQAAEAHQTPGSRHFSPGEQADNWDAELVRMIVTLCVNTDPAIEAWSVVVPLNEQVLPQTELFLTLSRHALSLRFQTQAPQSMRLLSLHRPSLAAMLQQALPGDRTIDIDLT